MNRDERRKRYGKKLLGIPVPGSQLELNLGLEYVNSEMTKQGTDKPMLNSDDFAEFLRKRIVNNGNGKPARN